MALSPAARVGIIVFIALLAFGAAAVFLTGWRARGYIITAVFDDVMGLTEGSPVTMAGVQIGRVDDITLNEKQQAIVRLKIRPEHCIPEGSVFMLRVGLLVGERTIDIVPNRGTTVCLRRGARVSGRIPVRIEDILPQAKELVTNLNAASASLREVLSDEEFESRVKRSLANIESATASLDRAMSTIEGTVAGQQDEIRSIVSNVVVASESLRSLTGELARVARDNRFPETIGETLASAQRAAASLERTTSSLETLVTAPEFQEDIRGTVAEARQAVEEARGVIGRVNRILGGGPSIRVNIPTRDTNLETLYKPDDGRFRTTLTTTIPVGTENFLRLGLHDIGATNKLILQPGQLIDSRADFRYGIYASKLGLGLDYAFTDRLYGSLDIYDPEDPRGDLLAGYRLGEHVDALLGVDRIFDDNQLTLGVRLRR